VTEDWSAVAATINERLAELGWQQQQLAERSNVSPSTIREIQRHTVERRRSPRTLESLSVTLGWRPDYLSTVLAGRDHGNGTNGAGTAQQGIESLDDRLSEIIRILYDLKSDLATVIDHVRGGP
jgi:transcriptional regulator with XRE-family HTH domain